MAQGLTVDSVCQIQRPSSSTVVCMKVQPSHCCEGNVRGVKRLLGDYAPRPAPSDAVLGNLNSSEVIKSPECSSL
jgi:hypothetical protein